MDIKEFDKIFSELTKDVDKNVMDELTIKAIRSIDSDSDVDIKDLLSVLNRKNFICIAEETIKIHNEHPDISYKEIAINNAKEAIEKTGYCYNLSCYLDIVNIVTKDDIRKYGSEVVLAVINSFSYIAKGAYLQFLSEIDDKINKIVDYDKSRSNDKLADKIKKMLNNGDITKEQIESILNHKN